MPDRIDAIPRPLEARIFHELSLLKIQGRLFRCSGLREMADNEEGSARSVRSKSEQLCVKQIYKALYKLHPENIGEFAFKTTEKHIVIINKHKYS